MQGALVGIWRKSSFKSPSVCPRKSLSSNLQQTSTALFRTHTSQSSFHSGSTMRRASFISPPSTGEMATVSMTVLFQEKGRGCPTLCLILQIDFMIHDPCKVYSPSAGQEIPCLYGVQVFITMFAKAYNWTLPCGS